jgi:hypothetical protein
MNIDVRQINQESAKAGKNLFVTIVFNHVDGCYYDPIGDEIFFAKRLYMTTLGPVYELDFGDDKVIGIMKDHGLHEYLAGVE